jgi:ADP-ribose pyrophosphatase
VKSNRAVGDRDGWQTISSETHFESDHLCVVTEQVRSPARAQARPWTTVYRKGAVVVAPMNADGKIVLIRQERVPIRAALWEMPAGQVDEETAGAAQNSEAIALRELREETGYELSSSGELISLGDFFSSAGFTNERASLFLARPVEPGANGPAHDESESILECRTFTSEEIGQMIAANEIRDANTLAICARLVARGLLSLRA